jgi:hypothetical protein
MVIYDGHSRAFRLDHELPPPAELEGACCDAIFMVWSSTPRATRKPAIS